MILNHNLVILIDLFQLWNHDFFWYSMKPGSGGKPYGELLKLIEGDFGSFEKIVEI